MNTTDQSKLKLSSKNIFVDRWTDSETDRDGWTDGQTELIIIYPAVGGAKLAELVLP